MANQPRASYSWYEDVSQSFREAGNVLILGTKLFPKISESDHNTLCRLMSLQVEFYPFAETESCGWFISPQNPHHFLGHPSDESLNALLRRMENLGYVVHRDGPGGEGCEFWINFDVILTDYCI